MSIPTKVLVTGRPDPDCKRCHGAGVVGGCEGRHTPNPAHMHTISWCSCVNERFENREEADDQ